MTHHPYGKEVPDISQFLVTEVYRIMDMHPGWFNLNYVNFDFHENCGLITSWKAPNTENQPGFNSIYRYIALLCMDTDIYMQIHFSGDFEDARETYFMDNVGNNILQHIEIWTSEKAAETTAQSKPAEESRTDHLKEQFLDNVKRMTWQDFTYELIFQEEKYAIRLSLPSCYNRIDERSFAADDTLVPLPYTPKCIYIGEPILLDQLAAYDREGKKISTGSQFHAAATNLILDAYPDLEIASQTHINLWGGHEFIVTWAENSEKDWPYRCTAFVYLGDDVYLQLHFSDGIFEADERAMVNWIKEDIFQPYGIEILAP